MNETYEKYLKDIYELGTIQGEHNINWKDEYHLLEHSKEYYEKIKKIAIKYNFKLNTLPEDYRESEDDDEHMLWDRMAFDMLENVKNHIKQLLIKNILH